jgi:ribosome-associated translation inhibitor RaiA
MQVQVHTGKNIEGGERLNLYVKTTVQAKLQRFVEQVTRIEAHLTDEHSHKSHDEDKKCVLEARPAGKPPVAVTHLAPTVDLAIHGAVEKMERVLDSTFGHGSHPKAPPVSDLV